MRQGRREEVEEALGEKEDVEYFQQRRHIKPKKEKKKVYYWTIVIAVSTSMLIDVKAHIPVLFLGSNSRSDVETTTRNQGRD